MRFSLFGLALQTHSGLRQVTLVSCKPGCTDIQHSLPLVCCAPLAGVLRALTLLRNWQVLAKLCDDEAKLDRLLLSLVDSMRLLRHVAKHPLPPLS